MNLENGGTALVLTESRPAKKLPYKVLEGLNTVMSLTELKVGPRNTLKTLLSFLSKHSTTGEIYARREKIAARAGASVPTVNRHIALLRTLGILTVGEQGRIHTPGHRYGDFTVTHIFFTPDFLKQIGWVQPDVSSNVPAKDDTPPADAYTLDTSIKMSAPIYQLLTNPSIDTKKDQGRQSEGTVPQDLLALVERDVWRKSIWKLMGMATQRGHRLSHVWQVTQSCIDRLGLTGKRLKNYLEKTILQGGDFAGRAAKAVAKAAAIAQESADRAYVFAFNQQYAGKTLSTPDGRSFIQVAAGGGNALYRVGSHDERIDLMSRRDIAPIIEKLERGELVVGFVAPPSIQKMDEALQLGDHVTGKDRAEQQLAKLRQLMSAPSTKKHPAARSTTPTERNSNVAGYVEMMRQILQAKPKLVCG